MARRKKQEPEEPMSICDRCSDSIPLSETNQCDCGGSFCNDCAHPSEHDCEFDGEDE